MTSEKEESEAFSQKSMDSTVEEAPLEGGVEPAPDERAPVSGERTCEEVIASLKEELERTRQEVKEMEDRWKRVLAEFQNYRKRVFQERAEAYEKGKKEAIVALLPVLDALERAHRSLKEGASLEAYRGGLDLIIRLFQEGLKGLEVDPISAEGHPYDPFLHEAVERIEREDLEDGTIITELQRGYLMGGKVIRPSLVTVSVKPSSPAVGTSSRAELETEVQAEEGGRVSEPDQEGPEMSP